MLTPHLIKLFSIYFRLSAKSVGRVIKLATFVCCAPLVVQNVLAQGEDTTRADRDIMIMAELLPGDYRNANQAYFDVRLKDPENSRHPSIYATVKRIDANAFGEWVFSSEHGDTKGESQVSYYLHTLEVDYDVGAVRMKNYSVSTAPKAKITRKAAVYMEGCDLLFVQQAGQFRGRAENSSCKADEAFADDVQLTENALWLNSPTSGLSPFALDRSRAFSCYVDVPGVGGGRDIPYERFQLDDMHDLGGEKWITTKDGQEIGVNLFRVMWPMNNYVGVFTRPSFVIYAKTKDEDGKNKEVGYAFTEPSAQRIGINLKWMLANCYMISNEDVTPFYGTNEPKL